MSASRFPVTVAIPMMNVAPSITGKSCASADCQNSKPMPGKLNTDSAITAPATMSGSDRPRIVMTGSSELRSTCLLSTRRRGSPFARAALM